MIRKIKHDTLSVKHWLNIKYNLHMDKNKIESDRLISQYLFEKDLLEVAISYYDIEDKEKHEYNIQHNKLLYYPNLKAFLHIMKQRPVLYDVYEQLAKIVTIISFIYFVWTRNWISLIAALCILYIFRNSHFQNWGLICAFSILMCLPAPYLIPMVIFNLCYLMRIREDVVYDIFIRGSRDK